jgi:hypothetical protein
MAEDATPLVEAPVAIIDASRAYAGRDRQGRVHHQAAQGGRHPKIIAAHGHLVGRPTCLSSATPAAAPIGEGVPVAHDRAPAGLDAPPLSPVALGMAARAGDKVNGLVRRLT